MPSPEMALPHLSLVAPAVQRCPAVLQVCANLGFGGSERVALQAAEAVQAAGGRAFIAGAPGGLVDEIIAKHVGFIPLPTAGYNPYTMLHNVGRLADILRREQIDVVHVHNRAPGWSALLAARHLGIPTVSTYHSAYGMNPGVKRFFNAVMARTDAVIVCSNYIGGYIDAHHGRDAGRRVLIRNGIDLDYFDPQAVRSEAVNTLRQTWGLDDDACVFVMPARFTRWKGHEVVIRAVARLLERAHTNFIVLFVGGDERRADFRSSIEDMMARLKVRDHIRLTGPLSDMRTVYALANYSLSASTSSENLSLALIEASAMERPVIATQLSASGEVVATPPGVAAEERTGWLVKPGDVDDLAQAMSEAMRLSRLERQKMGQRARKRMLEQFDVKAGLRRTVELYTNLHEARGSRLAKTA